jgi:hypothetical protein
MKRRGGRLEMGTSKKATDYQNQWLLKVVGPPGLELGKSHHRPKLSSTPWEVNLGT